MCCAISVCRSLREELKQQRQQEQEQRSKYDESLLQSIVEGMQQTQRVQESRDEERARDEMILMVSERLEQLLEVNARDVHSAITSLLLPKENRLLRSEKLELEQFIEQQRSSSQTVAQREAKARALVNVLSEMFSLS